MNKQLRRRSGLLSHCLTSIAAIGLLMNVAPTALGQTSGAGTITGTVTDPTGAVLTDAGVSVRNVETGIDRPVATNQAGIFFVTFLQPGNYEVTVKKAGFATTLRKDLRLQVGQTLTIDLRMTVQTTQDTVTVSGESPVVDTEKTEVSQVVSQVAVENLPIAGRRWDSFVLLTPNVTTDGGTGLISYRGIIGSLQPELGGWSQQ
jgi:Carboxypeptidase regulatory-like domain